MNPKLSPAGPKCLDDRHFRLVSEQYKVDDTSVTYLNTGGAGIKPEVVLSALDSGLKRFNYNPTRSTYFETELVEEARAACAGLVDADKESILLLDSTSQGLQLILQSFLLKPGDEVILTSQEHASSVAICRYLEDSRGVRVKKYRIPKGISSEQLCLDMVNLVTGNTRVVLVSEINCHTGWMPDLTLLVESLKLLDVPLLVDGAHAPGNCKANKYGAPLWVGAGHKWLGGPNSTAFAYIEKEYIPRILPVWIAGGFFETREAEIYDLRRFECKGHTDSLKWHGLTKAIELYKSLDSKHLSEYQDSLVQYLHSRVEKVPGLIVRTPGIQFAAGESHGNLFTFYGNHDLFSQPDLRESLWRDHKVWIQPDFLCKDSEQGIRISCHYVVTKEDIDMFFDSFLNYLN